MKLQWPRLTAKLSSRSLLAVGLSSIVICVLLVADMLGLVPDRNTAVREGRVALAESVALTSAMLSAGGDADALGRYLGNVVQRHPSVVGMRVRSAEGGFVAEAGNPAPMDTTVKESSDTRLVVPMLGGGELWGHAEMHFKPLSLQAEWLPWLPQAAPLAVFLGLLCALMFNAYLGRMLRHLDPGNAIPARVRTAFDTLAEGLLVLDPKGHIVLANRAFSNVAGLDADALVGLSAAKLPWTQRSGDGDTAGVAVAPPLLPWLQSQAEAKLLSGVVMFLPDAAGQRRTFMVNCSPIPGAGGKPAGVLVSLDDVTDLEEKELELRLARDAAQAANRAKSDFLANMSHEIRTPMNAILGFTELLRRGHQAGTADPQKYLNIIHGSGKHLLELINDILDLSKVEAGRLEVESVPCEAHQVVLDVARIMAVKAEEKGIGLRVVFDSPLPGQVHSDPSRLRQVVTNLVGNAIKFTARGEVRIHLRMEGTAAKRLLHIDVADSGIGIPPHRLESIFEPFVQAETSTTRQFGGTGLGLTISRRFARALGGDIVASSRPGLGSVFHVTVNPGTLDDATWLSVADLQARQLQDVQQAAQGVVWRFPRRRVLVVDDGNENRELVRLVLEDVGLEVVEADNGVVALERVDQHHPDLVLMDIQMPVMDGNTATRTLRERGHTLPILALTANAMKGFEREIEASGFTSFLTKPIDIDLMLATLAPHLGGQQADSAQAQVRPQAWPAASQSATPTAGASRPAASVLPVLHQAVDAQAPGPAGVAGGAGGPPILSRLANHPRLARVARSFCEQLPAKLAEMQHVLDERDFDALAALAHWLKGAGGTVGYDAFFEPARTLEQHAKAQQADGAAAVMQVLRGLCQRIVPPPEPGAGPGSTPASTSMSTSAPRTAMPA